MVGWSRRNDEDRRRWNQRRAAMSAKELAQYRKDEAEFDAKFVKWSCAVIVAIFAILLWRERTMGR